MLLSNSSLTLGSAITADSDRAVKPQEIFLEISGRADPHYNQLKAARRFDAT
jgi:hypothetical protein